MKNNASHDEVVRVAEENGKEPNKKGNWREIGCWMFTSIAIEWITDSLILKIVVFVSLDYFI
ncbi:hypothetical protein DERF_000888 [Dermatophagoides farinae]|uniref:Uncharacterized protein n=1 Tax=Dermatophagoides farinae TaxID=6954 RepID=A0A922ICI5_DERFA|nr:hypothetical protein DERF_000888 [Dermatophagoides farinae]